MKYTRLSRFTLAASLITLLLAAWPGGPPLAQAVRPPQARGDTSQAKPVQLAMAVQGDIYVLLVSGGLRRLTGGGNASRPVLSPDGRWVAYLVSPHKSPIGVAGPYAVWIVPTSGTSKVGPRRISDTRLGTDDYMVSWSPDSHVLAYFEGTDIVLRSITGTDAQTVLQPLTGFTFITTLSWSPSGGQFVVPLRQLGLGASQASPPLLQAAVYDRSAHHWTPITAHFASGALGQWPGGNTRSDAGGDISWAPDGQGFLFGTGLAGAGPIRLSGIWQVGLHGGLSHLVMGTPAGVRLGTVPTSSPLFMATHWTFSPNQRLIASDPDRRLWVGTIAGKDGRFLSVSRPHECARVFCDCTTAQDQWLRDGTGLAYLRECVVSSTVMVRSTLFRWTFKSTAPRIVLQRISQDQSVIDIGGAYRCVLCGY
ncbi:MAG TPA: hypothetical protein VIJ28_11720 [Chloroflexota bacterium]